MSAQMNIKRQPVIQRGCLTIDSQRYTVVLAGEEIDLYPGWVLSPEQIYETVWQGDMAGREHVVYNVIA